MEQREYVGFCDNGPGAKRREYTSCGAAPVYGGKLINEILERLEPESTILNVGIGAGFHTRLFLDEGHKVIGVSPSERSSDKDGLTCIVGVVEDLDLPPVDAVWSCMTLEHTQNVGLFLTACRKALKPGGLFGVVVPSDRPDIVVDGHLSFWTPVSLLYNMVIAGWDCCDAKWYTKKRDIALMVQRVDRPDIELVYTGGDLEKLQPYFPIPVLPRRTSPWLLDNFKN